MPYGLIETNQKLHSTSTHESYNTLNVQLPSHQMDLIDIFGNQLQQKKLVVFDLIHEYLCRTRGVTVCLHCILEVQLQPTQNKTLDQYIWI